MTKSPVIVDIETDVAAGEDARKIVVKGARVSHPELKKPRAKKGDDGIYRTTVGKITEVKSGIAKGRAVGKSPLLAMPFGRKRYGGIRGPMRTFYLASVAFPSTTQQRAMIDKDTKPNSIFLYAGLMTGVLVYDERRGYGVRYSRPGDKPAQLRRSFAA